MDMVVFSLPSVSTPDRLWPNDKLQRRMIGEMAPNEKKTTLSPVHYKQLSDAVLVKEAAENPPDQSGGLLLTPQ